MVKMSLRAEQVPNAKKDKKKLQLLAQDEGVFLEFTYRDLPMSPPLVKRHL